MGTTQADFDRIALLSREGWDHNTQYHGYLLRLIPAYCEAPLDDSLLLVEIQAGD